MTEPDAQAFEQIETSTDLLRILRLKVYRDKGCPFELLIRLGLTVPEAAAVELRRRGYEMEVIGMGGGSETAFGLRAEGRQPPAETAAAFDLRPVEGGVR